MKLPLKYSDYAIIPGDIVLKFKVNSKERYELINGEVVTFVFIAGYDNFRGTQKEILNEHCMELYGIPFVNFECVWYNRLGKLSGIWHKVRMVKVKNND